MNGYPSFYPRKALVAPSPGEEKIHIGANPHLSYPVLSMPFLLTPWRPKEPGHQQTWYWPNARNIRLEHEKHYNDVTMRATASQITGVSTVYSIVCSGADQRKPQSSASLAFVWGILRWPVKSHHKGPVTRKMFPFNDVIMKFSYVVGVLPAAILCYITRCVLHTRTENMDLEQKSMVTALPNHDGNAVHITDPLGVESTGYRWSVMQSFIATFEQTMELLRPHCFELGCPL